MRIYWSSTSEVPDARGLSDLFDPLPLLPRRLIEWLLDDSRYRRVRGVAVIRQLCALALAIRGEPATREQVGHILATSMAALRDALRRRLKRSRLRVPAGHGLKPRTV